MEPRADGKDVRQDQSFFGREEELLRLLKGLSEGRHTLLLGAFGIGKSSLMKEARMLMTGMKHRVEFRANPRTVERDRVLIVTSPVPLGDCLREIAGALYRQGALEIESGNERGDWAYVKQQFTRRGIQAMQSEVLRSLARGGKKYIVFVTGLERLSHTSLGFFQSLLRIAVVCGSAVELKDTGEFRCFWASFERIPVERLPGHVALRLITHLMNRYPVNVVDPMMCRKEILGAAGGNPFHIKNLLHRAATQKILGSREIRSFRGAEEGEFFNMGPLYMIGAGVLTAVKFFSVGAEKREHYIYYSAIGFMLYLTFRVFRGFFVFRPQRHR